ncbi:MAG TPA: tetratricopeptide repeat protein [Telluria sp.]|jgi:tetratricopeptide (TPR) repeat protein
MTAASFSTLDQSELIHLALEADRLGNSGASLSYLKEAVGRADATAPAHLLLGAGYAQLQMYDRAAAEMESALAVDPTFAIARFQLGLLQLTSGDGERAMSTLLPLQELDEQHALHQFGSGLIHLMRNEFAATLACMARGMELNTDNPALNTDMQLIVDKVNALPPEALAAAAPAGSGDPAATPVPVPPAQEQAQAPADDQVANPIFLSAYTSGGKQ